MPRNKVKVQSRTKVQNKAIPMLYKDCIQNFEKVYKLRRSENMSAKQKKPFYNRAWFVSIAIFFIVQVLFIFMEKTGRIVRYREIDGKLLGKVTIWRDYLDGMKRC